MELDMVISFFGQKGGVGKSTASISFATACANGGNSVVIADMDKHQQTARQWAEQRNALTSLCTIPTVCCEKPSEITRLQEDYDVVLVDGAAFAHMGTRAVAAISDWVVIPTGVSLFDLRPSLSLAEELKEVCRQIVFMVVKVPHRGDREAAGTIRIIREQGFQVIDRWLPMRTGYSQAFDRGLSISETSFPELNRIGDTISKQLVSCFTGGNK